MVDGMSVTYDDGMVTIINGDCRDVLAEMEPESVQCAITSPPYWNLRKYSGVEPSVWGGDGDTSSKAEGWRSDSVFPRFQHVQIR
jgi:DNA modification methylase